MRWLGELRRPRSSTLQEQEIACPEHRDDSDVYEQPRPEQVPKEQDVHDDHDGDHREHVKRNHCSSHSFFLLCPQGWNKRGPGLSETFALAGSAPMTRAGS